MYSTGWAVYLLIPAAELVNLLFKMCVQAHPARTEQLLRRIDEFLQDWEVNATSATFACWYSVRRESEQIQQHSN